MRLSFILARITARSGAALWRSRIVVLITVLALGALGVYELTYAGPTVSNGDCADTAMAAVTRGDEASAHAAYACLGPSMRNTSEDAFVAGMQERGMAHTQVSRVGDQKTKDGGRIVFFTVEQQDTAVGYIVYLDPIGKVIRVE
jgi:hypothetical protein